MLSLLDRFNEILDGYMRGNRPAPANLSSSRNLENSVGDDDPASSPSAGGSVHESYDDSWNNNYNQPSEQSDATLIAKVSSLFSKNSSSCDPEEVVQILNPVLARHGIDELDFRRVLSKQYYEKILLLRIYINLFSKIVKRNEQYLMKYGAIKQDFWLGLENNQLNGGSGYGSNVTFFQMCY